MIIKKILTFLFLSLISCKEKNLYKPKYFNNGNISERFFVDNSILNENYFNPKDISIDEITLDSARVYYSETKNGTLKKIDFYYNNNQKQVVFQNNGMILRFGLIKDEKPIEKWNFYNDGKLELTREYKIIKGKPYSNQEWFFNKNQDTIYAGFFFRFVAKSDTIIINKDYNIIVNLQEPFYKNLKSKILLCLSKPDSQDFNYDFSNEEVINKRCAFDFESLKVGKKGESINYAHVSNNYKSFNTLGKKIIRGIIYEYLVKEKDSLGLDKALENAHKMYFEIPVYVKDSI